MSGQGGEAIGEGELEAMSMPDDEAVQRILRRFKHLMSEQDDDE